MATSSEDALGELYAWDSTIDEMFDRGTDHPDFDEDEALEAYEEMIQVGGAPTETHDDAVLSLAAQLLTKHFYKFPHVHLNVVDVLLGLCNADRPQPVRIHTVRSLLQIVKSAPSATPPLVAACRKRIADHIAALIKAETSSVVARQLTQLQETLATIDTELKKAEKIERWKEKKEQAKAAAAARHEEQTRLKTSNNDQDDRHNKSEPVASREEKSADRDYDDRRREDIQREEAAKRERREARFRTAQMAESKDRDTASDSKKRDDRSLERVDDRDQQKRRDTASDSKRREDRSLERVDDRDQQKRRDTASDSKRREDRSVERVDDRDQQKRRDSYRDERDSQDRAPPHRAAEPPREEFTRERRPNAGGKEGNKCPPSSFIFMGGVPRNTYHEDIINYLSCIDESLTHSCVQIKFPNANPHAAGYAFVSLESVDHARKAIRHIQTTEFTGRNLIGDFARGPPCSTLQFVEHNGSLSMHDPNAVLPVDIETLDPSVWDELRALLNQYGSMEILRDGRIRFRDSESAKSVIRKHRFVVAGREFLPVYDPEEQAEIDSSKRRRRSDEEGDGRRENGASRYGGHNGADRRGSRDDDHRKRRRSQSFDREQKEKVPRRDQFDDKRIDNHHAPRDFDQARYGPRDTASSFKHRDETFRNDDFSSHRGDRRASRERESNADQRGREGQGERRNSSKVNSHRSASRSPMRSFPDSKRTSQRGRSRSRSHSKRFSDKRNGAMVDDSRRSKSPAKSTKSTSSAKRDRGDNDEYRERRASSSAFQEEVHGSRVNKDRHRSPPSFQPESSAGHDYRHKRSHDKDRSRSPTKRKDYSDDRRGQESGRSAHEDRASHTSRGRSHSPRRVPVPERTGNGAYERFENNRDEQRRGHERPREFNHDEQQNLDKYGSKYRGSDDRITSSSHRKETRPSRSGEDEREPSGHRGSSFQQVSKYGTVGGRERSPSPAHLERDEQSRARDQGDRFKRGDETHRGNSFKDSSQQRYGNENHSRENRDQRTNNHFDNYGKRQMHKREPSPDPKHLANRDEFGHGGRRRSRSPSPFNPNVHKKPRSRSPRSTDEGGRDREHRAPRFDGGDRRKYDDHDRHSKRDHAGEGRSRYEGKSKDDRGRDRDDRHARERNKPRESSPFKNVKRDEDHPRSPTPLTSRDEHTRTPSPMVFDDDATLDSNREQEVSSRSSVKGAVSSAYEDIDECMVDYEEDEE